METSELIESLKKQILVQNNADLAKRLAEDSAVEEVKCGDTVMEEDDPGSDMLMILSGKFEVLIGGTKLSELSAGNHVGEMAIVDPESNRSATIVAAEDSVVARLDGNHFESVANDYPSLWKNLARELANRLRQTNRWLTEWEPKPEVPAPEEEFTG